MSVELLAFTDPVCTWCWGSDVFDLSPGEYEALVGGLETENRIRRVPAGNGYFLEPVAPGAACDA